MTKISYEVCELGSTKEEVKINLKGTGGDLFKGICRLANNLKKKLNIENDKEFLDLMEIGMMLADLEKKSDETDEDMSLINAMAMFLEKMSK